MHDPAIEQIAAIANEAAATPTRWLVLLMGVSEVEKKLVGLTGVHVGFL